MKTNIPVCSAIVTATALALSLAANAQSINQSNEAYIDRPMLPFAPVAVVTPVAPMAAASSLATAAAFEVLSTDRTIREVLQRWARSSGWKHDQVHWTLLRDFPIEGTASAEAFKGDFRYAVRTLLSSTEATDLPVQPCFYTNFIVRVVPRAEVCDRNPVASAAQ
jgi:type II secretory pathway component PulK